MIGFLTRSTREPGDPPLRDDYVRGFVKRAVERAEAEYPEPPLELSGLRGTEHWRRDLRLAEVRHRAVREGQLSYAALPEVLARLAKWRKAMEAWRTPAVHLEDLEKSRARIVASLRDLARSTSGVSSTGYLAPSDPGAEKERADLRAQIERIDAMIAQGRPEVDRLQAEVDRWAER